MSVRGIVTVIETGIGAADITGMVTTTAAATGMRGTGIETGIGTGTGTEGTETGTRTGIKIGTEIETEIGRAGYVGSV